MLGSHWQSMDDLKSLRTINEPCNMRKAILEIFSEADSLWGWNWLMSLTSTSTLDKVWGPAKTQGTKKHEPKVWCRPEILLLPYKRNLDIKLNVWWGSSKIQLLPSLLGRDLYLWIFIVFIPFSSPPLIYLFSARFLLFFFSTAFD